MFTDHDRDVFVLGVTADCEAANQGDDGLIAVMHAIINRTKAGKWFSGKTIAATCVMPYAFSSWNTKDPNRVRVLSTGVADPTMYKCLQLAEQVVSGNLPDPTDGATHYYSVKVIPGDPPDWVTGKAPDVPPATFTTQIHDHKFYKGVA